MDTVAVQWRMDQGVAGECVGQDEQAVLLYQGVAKLKVCVSGAKKLEDFVLTAVDKLGEITVHAVTVEDKTQEVYSCCITPLLPTLVTSNLPASETNTPREFIKSLMSRCTRDLNLF